MGAPDLTPVIQLAIQEVPNIISLFRELFKKANPTEPDPTDEEVMTAFESAFESSRAKDLNWLAAHPEV